ncbi:LytTR family DNA-binding domain-containing protein [Streptococcus tangpeifui]|uniref:LytTR family DNA-binding domain-containing protein n=1 Tax=Streptococcus tangpeifui TaxID=2709400 RepID=UPI0013EA76D0|nr:MULTISPECIES: LytTR family DNA-binding domain-containing protein [unclassified Streptococcus]
MKLRLEHISDGQEEVIVRYRTMTPTIQAISNLVTQGQEKILGRNEQGERYLALDDILYFESIDGKTFAYTQKKVYQVACTLKDLVSNYAFKGFFRCTKAMVVNIYQIQSFKSQAYGRIEATLDNGERVLISRKYANKLRQVLQEGIKDED